MSVIHHLVAESNAECEENAIQAVRTALSVLDNDGKLLIFEPALAPAQYPGFAYEIKRRSMRVTGNRRFELGRGWANIGAPLVRFYTPESLTKMITRAGERLKRSTL